MTKSKLLIQVALLTIGYGSCFSQVPDIKAGLSLSTITSPVSPRNRLLPGFYLGIASHKNLNDKISIAAEFVYSLQGAKSDDLKARYSYINLPLLFSFKTEDDITLNAGTQVGMLFNAFTKGTVKENITAKLNTLDLSLVGGIGIPLTDFLKLEGRINFGLTNTVRNPVPDGSYRNIVIQVGGVFMLKKKPK
jgi:hypothetical protein